MLIFAGINKSCYNIFYVFTLKTVSMSATLFMVHIIHLCFLYFLCSAVYEHVKEAGNCDRFPQMSLITYNLYIPQSSRSSLPLLISPLDKLTQDDFLIF